MVSVDRHTSIHYHNKMAFKFVVLCAALACANAGLIPAAAPLAYSPATSVSHAYISQPAVAVAHAAPLAIHDPAVGTSHQNVYRSLGGNAAISTYSKAVDSAFSSVRKYDTRVTNDALPVYAHATYAHAAPVTTYTHAAPITTYAHAPVATYASAPVATYSAGPVVARASLPVAHTYAAAAPVVAKTAITYSPSVAVSHMSYSAPGISYAW